MKTIFDHRNKTHSYTVVCDGARAQRIPYPDTLIKKERPEAEAKTEEQQSEDDLLNDGRKLLAGLHAYYGNDVNANEQLLTDCVKLLNTLHACESYNKNDENLKSGNE